MKARPIQTLLLVFCAWVMAILLYDRVEAIHRGGPVMILIVMCSMFALTIVLERLFYFTRLGTDMRGYLDRLRDAVHGRNWSEAEAICRMARGPIARVAASGLAARDEPPETIEQLMEEAARDEEPGIELHVRWLATLAQVSTLLGLLGTVIGMVEAFQVIQSQATVATPVSPGDLAGGIWQALTTTVAGLEVAIPTIVAYHYLLSRIAEVQFQMEKVTRLVAGWRHAAPAK